MHTHTYTPRATTTCDHLKAPLTSLPRAKTPTPANKKHSQNNDKMKNKQREAHIHTTRLHTPVTMSLFFFFFFCSFLSIGSTTHDFTDSGQTLTGSRSKYKKEVAYMLGAHGYRYVWVINS